jgi:GNAT superfamily N-acetyltransferase
MSTIEIIACDYTQASHLKGIITLINSYIKDDMGGGIPLDPSQQMQLVYSLEQHPTSVVLLACCDGTICGLLIAFENLSTFTVKPMLNIHDIVVLPDYRHRGIGRLLLKTTIDTAVERGCCRVTLEVRHDNHIAQQLYASMGFEDTQPPMYYWRKELM